MDKKISVIGAGHVGATTAQRIIEKDLADVVLVDIVEGLAEGKALDLMESAPIEGFNAKIVGTSDYSQTKDSDIVIITAGLARKPGMSRDDLQATNAKIVSSIVDSIMKHNSETILLIVTNPLDVMSYLAHKQSGLASNKVIGMAGVLDSARYRYFIADELKISPEIVEAMVLGGHGDSMVPLPKYSTVSGIPITQLISKERIEAINDRTRKAGAEIVKLLKTGSAFYSPSAAVTQMAKSILLDENKILPSCVYLKGEYDLNDVYCGLPAKLGRGGLKEIVQIELSEQEKKALTLSSEAVKANINKLNL